jgi:hypothetical protein
MQRKAIIRRHRIRHSTLLLLASALVLGAGTAAAGISFQPMGNYFVHMSPRTVRTADLDNDGDPDMVVACQGGGVGRVTVRLNNGGGQFNNRTDYNVGQNPHSVAIADLDGDGDRDLAVAALTSGSLNILRNDGTGHFVNDAQHPVGTSAVSVDVSDLDGDLDQDVAIVSLTPPRLSIFFNDGGGNFGSPVVYTTSPDPHFVQCADMDGDADKDVMVAVENAVFLYRNDGAGALTGTGIPGPFGIEGLALPDLDQDGDLDVALAIAGTVCSTPNSVAFLYRNFGNGTFSGLTQPQAGPLPFALASADFDLDGDVDLAVANRGKCVDGTFVTGNTISVLENDSTGTFGAPLTFPASAEPIDVTTADVDGDGKLDILVACAESETVTVLINTSTPPPPPPPPFVPGPVILGITDIGNDQGRWVDVHWKRSDWDATGDSVVITGYALYRRIDPLPSPAAALPLAASIQPSSPARRALAFPPGSWHYILTVPARLEPEYHVVAPTLADSTVASGMHRTTFFLSALTSSIEQFYDGPPDSGYSLDNLAPSTPPAAAMQILGESIHLSWAAVEDRDVSHYSIHHGDLPSFEPSPVNRLGTTSGLEFTDVSPTFQGFYKILAIDLAGNAGLSATLSVSVSGVSETGEAPRALTLGPSVPNPASGHAAIGFGLPSSGRTTLEVMDAHGRLVRSLVAEHLRAGSYARIWDLRDQQGRAVPTGIYFVRMRSADGGTLSRKVTVLR